MEPSGYTTPEQIEEMRREIEQHKQRGGNTRPRTRVGRIIEWTLFFIVVLSLSYALIVVQLAKNEGAVPGLFGYYLFSVQSGSMEPTLSVGSVLLCRETKDPARLLENEIVTFRTLSGDVVTHRIVEVLEDGNSVSYRTRGDNPNNSPDSELLTPDRVLAVFVLKIPLT